MNNILFYIGLFITLVLAGSYLIVIWKKEKTKLFNEQVKECFKNSIKIAEIIKAPMQNVLDEVKTNFDKKYMQEKLELKINTENKIKDLNDDTINKLIDTGLSKDEAVNYLKGV
jgi:hypothetical protein